MTLTQGCSDERARERVSSRESVEVEIDIKGKCGGGGKGDADAESDVDGRVWRVRARANMEVG